MNSYEYFVIDDLSAKERARIFAKIDLDSNTCWNWTGALDQQGYGLVWFRGRVERIHRLMFAWKVKPIPRGIKARIDAQLDHSVCHNPRCCNPEHLQLVPQAVNTLRGNGPTAINARKTHCIHGHLLKTTANGKRRACPTCDSIRQKLRRKGPNREYWLQKQREASKRYYNKHRKP